MTSDGGTNTRMSQMAVVGQVSCTLVRALCLSDILMDTVIMFEHIQQSNKICNQRYSNICCASIEMANCHALINVIVLAHITCILLALLQ